MRIRAALSVVPILVLAGLAAMAPRVAADDHRRGERDGHHGKSERHGREGDHDEGEEHGGPLMRPGEDCLSCHDGRGEARRLGAAGTVFRAGGGGAGGVAVTVTVGGRSIATTTNAAGNFYVTATGPVTAATVSGLGAMPDGAAIDGRCNACHAGDGRLAVP